MEPAPTEAPSASRIGAISIAVMSVLATSIVALDAVTSLKDIRIMIQNWKDLVQNVKEGRLKQQIAEKLPAKLAPKPPPAPPQQPVRPRYYP